MSKAANSKKVVSIHVRLTKERKRQFAELAAQRHVAEAKLLRQLITEALQPKPRYEVASNYKPSTRGTCTIYLRRTDMRTLRERAALRNLAAASYVTALVHAHLGLRPFAPKLERESLASAVAELNSVGRNLDYLVRAANSGVTWASGLRKELADLLQSFDAITDTMRELVRVNRKSWGVGDLETMRTSIS